MVYLKPESDPKQTLDAIQQSLDNIRQAGISDALDGWIAKQFSLQSRLGSILDPVADKVLLTCSFITLYWIGVLPLWLLMIIFVRDVIIIAGALGYFLGEESSESGLLEPSLISKVNTVLQIALVL